VAEIRPYFAEEEEIPSLSSKSNQPREDDRGHLPKSFETLPDGPTQVKESKVIKKV